MCIAQTISPRARSGVRAELQGARLPSLVDRAHTGKVQPF